MARMSRHHPDARAARDLRYSRDEGDFLPDPEPTVKADRCSNCGTKCIGTTCRSCLRSGPDDRRVRSGR